MISNFSQDTIYLLLIYITLDPYAFNESRNLYDLKDVHKGLILSTIKEFEKDYNKDTQFFLDVIKSKKDDLVKNWQKYFNPENLGKMLALYTMTGTSHYMLHNMVFYINPADGRIYFFPWDFMNKGGFNTINEKQSNKRRLEKL